MKPRRVTSIGVILLIKLESNPIPDNGFMNETATFPTVSFERLNG